VSVSVIVEGATLPRSMASERRAAIRAAAPGANANGRSGAEYRQAAEEEAARAEQVGEVTGAEYRRRQH
jgi:hypothetical protein